MNLTIQAKALRALTATLGSVVTNRPTLPVLGAILLRRDGDRLRGTTTNLDTTLSSTAEAADLVGDFSCLVPFSVLDQIAKSFTGAITLTCDPKKGSLILEHYGSRYELSGLRPDEFPPAPAVSPKEEVELSLSATRLRTTLSALIERCSDDGNHANRSVVHLFPTGDRELFLVGQDGRRAAVQKLATGTEYDWRRVAYARMQLAMARSAIQLIGQAEEGDLAVLTLPRAAKAIDPKEATGGLFRLTTSRGQMIGKLAEAGLLQLCDLRKILDTVPWSGGCPISGEAWHGALKRAALCTSAAKPAVTLSNTTRGLTLQVETDEQSFSETLPDVIRPEFGSLHLNGEFLECALRRATELAPLDGVSIAILDPLSPIGIQVESSGWMEIISPMRL